jgi:hypothetical protein
LATSQYNEEGNMEESNNKSKINTKTQDKIKQLENERDEKDKEIDRLEKEYLEKIARLLVMTQIHCEIKTDIYNKFDKMGITSHVEEVKEEGEPEQSFHK